MKKAKAKEEDSSSKSKKTPLFSGRISGVSQFQVWVEHLYGNILVAYVQKARKNEEAFGGPLVGALADSSADC